MTQPPSGAPPGPPPGPPLGPERLAKLLEHAVRHVTAPDDALDRIHRGVRRRRAAHRAGTVLLAVAVLAGGGSAALAVTSGRVPPRLASAADAQATRPVTAQTTSMDHSAPSGKQLAPVPTPSAGFSAADAASPQASSRFDVEASPTAGWDMDGDGRPDTAAIVPVGNAKTTSQFMLVVQLTQLGTQTVRFTATSMTDMPPHGPVIVGAADAAHDGRAELFVQVDAGCCTEFWTIFRLVNGHVGQLTASGVPVAFAVGGSVLNNGGFSCAGPDLVVRFYREQSGGPATYAFQAVRDTYRWAGATLVLVSRQTTTIRGAPADPALAAYRGVSCGSLPQYEPVR
jgi:hypothetical protein